MDTEKTKVIFRAFRDCYQHLGQHGSCARSVVMGSGWRAGTHDEGLSNGVPESVTIIKIASEAADAFMKQREVGL